MKKMRDIYAVSFVSLVDSAWMPKVEMKTFKGFDLGGSNDYIRVKTSANQEPVFERINVKKFKSKEEFISHMVQDAIKVWDNYEAEKQFDEESRSIIDDIDNNKEVDLGNELLDDEDEWIKDFYKHKPLDNDASEEDIVTRIKDIKGRDLGGWEPYIIMREIYGLDFIRGPSDIATEENVANMKSKRPDPENNNGLFRRAKPRRGKVWA